MSKQLLTLIDAHLRLYFESPLGSLDDPTPDDVITGPFLVRGWAFSARGEITAIKVFLNGELLGDAEYGLERMDVPGSLNGVLTANVGYQYAIELPADYPHEHAEIAVRISESRGKELLFSRTVAVSLPEPEPEPLPMPYTDYEIWIARNEPSAVELESQQTQAKQLAYRPLFSLLLTEDGVLATPIRALLESLRAQTYDRWELCLALPDDLSAELRQLLADLAAADARIRLQVLPADQAAHRFPTALAMATGEFVALLSDAGVLAPNALFETASFLNRQADADFFYSDEDRLDETGLRFSPLFKPEWSPDLLRAQHYTGALSFYRTALVRELGELTGQAIGAALEYELALRVSERTHRIFRLPLVLFHRRAEAAGVAQDAAGWQAAIVAEHCRRIGWECEVSVAEAAPVTRCRRIQRPEPLVSIVIPTRDRADLLGRCVESILTRSSYQKFELLIVDNDSQEADTAALLADYAAHANIRVLSHPGAFNYSRINNVAVAQAAGEYVLLLNNDIEIVTPDWLEALLDYGTRPDVGAVGAKLLYENRQIQHAGVILGVGDMADHAHRYLPETEPGYANRAISAQNFSAVTGACLLTRRDLYQQLGGLDEVNLPISYNDVDYCLRLREQDYLIVWTPYAVLVHYESVSRNRDDHPDRIIAAGHEAGYLHRRWRAWIANDPYYSPNLSLHAPDFSLARYTRA